MSHENQLVKFCVIAENSYWFEGFSHTGSVAPTITLAWAAFKGEKS